jgi:hypothetical protein
MSSKAIITALKWVVLWSIMVFFVGLLCLIFSFLGAIFCAGLAGMMLGATRHSKWLPLPLAAVFPGVLWLVLHLSKAELPDHQVELLMVVSFATFWFTYAIALALVVFERKGRRADGALPQVQPAIGKKLGLGTASHPSRAAWAQEPAPATATASVGGLTLRELQGKWWHQVTALHAPEQNECLEIEDNQVTLSAFDPDGKVRRSLQGKLRVESSASYPAVAMCGGYAEWPADLSVSI